jgi:ParB family chromosome partitioning protein
MFVLQAIKRNQNKEVKSMMLLNQLTQERRKVVEISLDKIVPNPSQPRRIFAQNELDSLSESIRANGLLQPILVRKKGFGYELIAGERRLRACRIAGLKTVSCIVNDCDEKQSAIFAMLENLQRQDLQLFEEAEGIQRLIAEWGVTQEEAASRLGKSQSTLANKMRLLRLSPEQRKKITEAGLTERHARALLRITQEDKRDLVLDEIIDKNLNVHQTDELIESLMTPIPVLEEPKSKMSRTFIVKDIRIFMNTINNAIDMMKKSGIQAVTQKKETEDYIECVVRIPKARQA